MILDSIDSNSRLKKCIFLTMAIWGRKELHMLPLRASARSQFSVGSRRPQTSAASAASDRMDLLYPPHHNKVGHTSNGRRSGGWDWEPVFGGETKNHVFAATSARSFLDGGVHVPWGSSTCLTASDASTTRHRP